MTFNTGTKIGRYEIRSLLGAGGMGEVYRAFDMELEREVALKFLKQTDDAEKLRRFRQEAKAVSALNHPNIMTIHEVGNFDDYNFIVSEIVNGENLRDVISRQNLSLKEVLHIGVQIGNALAAAHAVGIVHRDIKPENVMVLPDGYVKVLDFGLAKFIGAEKFASNDSDASTASFIQTKAGMIIGTVNYMSPEQLRGKPVDERTDVWSLGVVLFETLTRRRPFTGESVSDVIAAVLEHSAPQISHFGVADVSPEIESIIGKSLEKNAANRFQTAREFVSALKNSELVSNNGYSAAAGKNSSANSFHYQKTLSTDHNQTAAATKNLSGLFIAGTRVRWRVIGLSGFLLMLAATAGGWVYLSRRLAAQMPVKQMKTWQKTTTGNIVNGTISPDGNLIVYVQNNNNGEQSLWLRQTEENAEKQLIPASAESYAGLTFTPDGNWIYYTVFGGSGVGKLRRIQLLGGSPQEIAGDVDSAVAFAPDGKRFAFIRSNPNEGIDRIIILNADESGERILTEKKRPEFYTTNSVQQSLSWSPDGKFIACPFGKTETTGELMSVAEINVETGEEKPLTETKWYRVGRVLWTKNDDELLITAAEEFGSESYQIRKIFRSSGQVRNVTGEANNYYNLSLNKDSTLLLGVAYNKTSKLYTASSEQPNQTNQLTGGSYDGIGGVLWTTDERIVYVSMENGNRDIWVKNADGGNSQQLTFDKAADDSPNVSNDGKHIVFVSLRTGVPHIWRMNLSGSEAKQITDKGGENLPSITPDGNFVIYSKTEGRPVLWKTSIEGGKPVQLTGEQTNSPAVSPDGKFVACLSRDTTFDPPLRLALVSADTGDFLKTFSLSGPVSSPGLPAVIRWMPDGQAIAYVATIEGISNIWMQPVGGGEPKKLTDFKSDRIFSFDFSKNGKRIVYARGTLRNDLVLIKDF